MAHDWHCFLWTADEWIVSYSLPPQSLMSVKLFSIGHALELYLKACYTKQTGDINKAISFGHDVPGIWAACKAEDSNFLPDHELREPILQRNILDGKDLESLPRPDLMHSVKNREFYLVSKHLADLKYLGAPLKTHKGPYAFGLSPCNPLWATLFHDLRCYLKYPEPHEFDLLRDVQTKEQLPALTVLFLNQILCG